jgi:hypothetical protein
MRGKKRHYYWTKRQTPVIQSTKTPAAQRTPSTNDNLSAKAEQPNADSPTLERSEKQDTKGKSSDTFTRDYDRTQEQPPLSAIELPKPYPLVLGTTTPEKPVERAQPLVLTTNATPDVNDELPDRSLDNQKTVSDPPKRLTNKSHDDGTAMTPDQTASPGVAENKAADRAQLDVSKSNVDTTDTANKPPTPEHPTHLIRVNPWPKRLKPLIGSIAKAIAWTPPRPFDTTAFNFEPTMEAAQSNLQTLEDHAYDLQAIIMGEAAKNTPLRPGSEFRPVELLNEIFLNHPLWPRVRRTLSRGFTMPLRSLPNLDRVLNVYEALRYGNHKSTHANPEVVLEMLNEEVRYGWQLVLPAKSIPQIPETIVSPLGLVKQTTINEFGESAIKWRLTHDQSFRFQSKTSVNSRVEKEKLADCLYGSALRCFLHAIVLYRRRFPTAPLLIAKFDLKSAYRRTHFSGISALQSIATSSGLHLSTTDSDELAYVSLRFTFGGSPNPSEFSLISEMIADLSNVLLQHKDWDPLNLHSEFISIVNPTPKLEQNNVEFTQARELLNEWEMSDYGVTEAYIDDIFVVFPFASDDHLERGRNAPLLAIDVMGRPTHDNDPLPRDPIVALKKLKAEGTPAEKMTVLGWQIDTRRLLIQLPTEKAKSWDGELGSLIVDGDKGLEIKLK